MLYKCFRQNFVTTAAAAAVLCVAAPALPASINITATNGSATISKDVNGDSLRISGAQTSGETTVSIESGATLTLLGTGSRAELFNAANTSFNVVNSTLSLGSDTAAAGGRLNGSVTLWDGLLKVNKETFTISSPGSVLGGYGTNSAIEINHGAILSLDRAGAATGPLGAISLAGESALSIANGVYVNKININSGSIRVTNRNIDGDVENSVFGDPSARLNDASISATRGDIILGRIDSTGGGHELNWSTINANNGNIRINGAVSVNGGLTSLIAENGDIVLANGDINESGDGHLYIRASKISPRKIRI